MRRKKKPAIKATKNTSKAKTLRKNTTKASKVAPKKSAPQPASSSELKKELLSIDKDRKHLARHLDDRLQNLYDRTAMIEKQLIGLADNKFYRTCIFGSARTKPDTKLYNDVFELARLLAWEGIDVLTGGGPGLMEAANKGALAGQSERKTKSRTYGLSIELPFEPDVNPHLDIKRHHQKFSSRLDDFMRLSNSIICTPGGIGTVLELFFSWQLIQVKHISKRPIILMGKDFWEGIIEWMKEYPLNQKLVSDSDFEVIYIVDSPQEAAEKIHQHHKEFRTSTSTFARV